MATNLRKLAQDEPCVRCGSHGTTVLAHYNGDYNHVVGKGMGKKAHDLAGAFLCHKCHLHFDNRESRGINRELEWFKCILSTHYVIMSKYKLEVK